MLVLSRQINESIMIGDTIEITIVDVKGDKVRVGITAPRDVTVHRKEVYLAILEENLAASKGADIDTLADLGEMFGNKSNPQSQSGKSSGRHQKPHDKE